MPWADLTDIRCYFELKGAGPALLLIPGLGATCRCWDPVAPALAEQFCLIAPDNRGVGGSAAKQPAHSMRHYSADLVELLDYLQVPTAHVLGLSFGGVIAQQFAMDHPQRVDRLVLMSCTHRFSPYLREMMNLVAQSIRHFPRQLFARTMELLGVSPLVLDANPRLLDERIQREQQLAVPRRAIVEQLRCLAATDLVDGGRYHIAAPTLVVAGQFDHLIPPCYAQQMAEAIDNSRLLIVQDAGHNPLAERAEQVIPAVIEFLQTGGFDAMRFAQTSAVASGVT